MARRPRHSAFEDFPLPQTEKQTSEKNHLADTAVTDVERIQRIVPSKMMPDRFQPRRLLPAMLRNDFYRGITTCYQAAAQWLKLANNDQGMEDEVNKLLLMAETIDDHGQIKPITGAWKMNAAGDYFFQIETGERRFWAACLSYVKNREKVEPRLRIEEVMNPTRQRQVLENRHAEMPSAVEQACEVAALILAETGVEPDASLEDDYQFFRQARERRMPAGLWDKISPIMQLTRPRMVQLLNILQLPSHLLDKADRYRLPERVLREIVSRPEAQWEMLIEQAIDSSLTSEEVADLARETSTVEIIEKPRRDPVPEPQRLASRYVTRFVNLCRGLQSEDQEALIDGLATELTTAGAGEQAKVLFEKLVVAIQIRTE